MASGASIKINSSNWKKYVKRISSSSSYTRDLLNAWAKIYLAFLQRRFRNNARGGGEWPKISDEWAKEKGSTQILIHTGKLFRALQLGATGNDVTISPSTLSVLIGYSDTNHTGTLTYKQLGTFHQEGEGNNPVRTIFIPPDQKTMKLMVRAAQIAFDRATRGLK